MKTIPIFFVLLFLTTLSFAQDKLEREYRIKESAVPASALEFIHSSFDNINVKWYGEENLNGKAIEAKGRHNGQLYSIKFNTDGVLRDVEVVIKFNAIPDNIQAEIEKNLKNRYSKFQIQKTQRQWLGSPAELRALIRGEQVSGQYTTNYEITFKGTKGRQTDYYEVLSNDRGELIRESKIVLRNNHHLIY